MALLAICNVILSKVCRQDEIILGVPAISRRYADLESIIGLFLNTLALRNYPTGEKTFREFLKEVREHTLNAFQNQDYPYEELVNHLFNKRDSSRNSLFDVVFAMQVNDMIMVNEGAPGIEIPGLKITPYEIEARRSPFDLVFHVEDYRRKIHFSIYYRTDLFKTETIRRLMDNFEEVLTAALENPNTRLRDISISNHFLQAAPGTLLEDVGDFGF
jgi:non-ribosomal peptide synthetase component F